MRALPNPQPLQTAPVRLDPEFALVPQPPPGERARQLLAQARAASLEHLDALQSALGEAHELANGVARCGDLYGPGVNDLARRVAEDLLWQSKSLAALAVRQRERAKQR